MSNGYTFVPRGNTALRIVHLALRGGLAALGLPAVTSRTVPGASAEEEGQRPNVILVFMDDYGWGEAGWTDPDFDRQESAFYYVRVIEIPTPRWTAYEAKRYGVEMPDSVPMVTQERAYTSPIWYGP